MKKINRTKWIASMTITFCLATTPINVRADLKDILLRFQPYVSVQEQYSNNINLTATNKKEDFITTINAGLKLTPLLRAAVSGELPKAPTPADQKYGIDLDYRIGLVFYTREPDNNYISHYGILNAWYSFAPNLVFRVREYLIRSDEPREADYAPGALPGQYLPAYQTNRAIYLRNVFEPSLEYRFGRENLISINYHNNSYWNQSRTSENSQDNSVGLGLFYWFDIRNAFSLSYGVDIGDFKKSQNFASHTAAARYTHRFDPRTSIFGDFYFRTHDSESTANLNPSTGDYNVYVPTIGITHSFTPTLSGSAQLGYFWQDLKNGSKTSGPYINIGLTQRVQKTTYALSLYSGYIEDYFTAENKGFTKYYRAIGTVTHQLKERITAGVYGSFEYEDSKPNQIDRIWGIGGNVSYQILRWLSLSLEAGYRENNSNISTRDYGEFRGSFSATATYPIN
jgi:hypothetical protein